MAPDTAPSAEAARTASGTGAERSRRRSSRTAVLAAVVLALLLWLVLYPNLYVLADSLRMSGRWTLAAYARFVRSPSELGALWNSIWISLASVALSGLVGVPLAFLFTRFDFPGRRLLAALAAVPVLLPPLVGVIAFLFLYGETGFITRGVQLLLGLRAPPWRLNGPAAILLVHTYTMYVYFYMFTSAALARLDPAQAQAARALGASGPTVLRRVTLPLLFPAIGGAALLVFMTSMGSFSAPYVFGGGFRVLTTQIFVSKLNGTPEDLALAAVEAVVLAATSLLFLGLLERLERGRAYTGAGKGIAPVRRRGAADVGAGVVAFLVVLVLVLPHLTVALVSLVPIGTWTTELFPPRLSLVNYRLMFTEPARLRPILNSLSMATTATLANVALAVAAAWLIVRRSFRGKGLMSALVVLPWALPGTVLALALATTFSVHAPWLGRFVLVGTAAILPLAYFIRDIPLVTRAALTSFRQLDPAVEEAAASLGAGPARTLGRVVLPLVLPGLLAGALLAFVTALGEFVASILLYTHATRPISVEILSQLRAFDFGAAAAYAVLLIVVMAIVFGIGQMAAADDAVRRGGG
ncbi:MAG: iron ABC transporter permease [Gemmatimonadetes bacterium]|nr:iron ABC transporter permease [Gemmatimonadota bacterium]